MMLGFGGFAAPLARAHHLHDSAGAWPVLADARGCFPCPHRPGGVAAMADFFVLYFYREAMAVDELVADLPVQRLLVALLLRRRLRLDSQEDVGALGEAPPKNAFVVWRASVWISTPSRSIVARSSCSAAR